MLGAWLTSWGFVGANDGPALAAGLPAAQVGPASSFAGLGIGPLQLTNVVEEAEIKWDLGIPDQDINFTTVGQLADYILQWEG